MKKLVVVGAGGFGREVVQLAVHENKFQPTWEILGFVDDNQELHGKQLNGFPVLGGLDWLMAHQGDKHAILALGEPEVRRKVNEYLQGAGIRYATLIHPSAVIGDFVDIGEGTIIAAGGVLTVNINVGKHVIINVNSVIGHDVVLGNYTTLAPDVNVMGASAVGEGCYVATGVIIRDEVVIGPNSIIGMGSVVVGDLPGDVVALGCPAKVVRENKTRRIFK